jgi:hypothetical protein
MFSMTFMPRARSLLAGCTATHWMPGTPAMASRKPVRRASWVATPSTPRITATLPLPPMVRTTYSPASRPLGSAAAEPESLGGRHSRFHLRR